MTDKRMISGYNKAVNKIMLHQIKNTTKLYGVMVQIFFPKNNELDPAMMLHGGDVTYSENPDLSGQMLIPELVTFNSISDGSELEHFIDGLKAYYVYGQIPLYSKIIVLDDTITSSFIVGDKSTISGQSHGGHVEILTLIPSASYPIANLDELAELDALETSLIEQEDPVMVEQNLNKNKLEKPLPNTVTKSKITVK